MSESIRQFRRRWAMRTAAPMFWVSLLFLANTAMSIVLWVDVPRVSEAYLRHSVATQLAGAADSSTLSPLQIDRHAHRLRIATLAFALMLWPIFLAEFLFYYWTAIDRPRFTRMALIACFCPPVRLGAPNAEMRGRIWLPKYGWTRPTAHVRRELEKHFSMPMIVIALMILPILLVEFGLKEQVAERTWLRVALHACTGTIWFAFALEFIVMCSVAKKKLEYCKIHWLDLAIVVLPLISFLRSLRIMRASRLARLAKVQQLTRLGRVYRLRGLAIKAFRGMAVFEVMNRLLRITPERQVELLREQLAETESEARYLRRRIAAIECQIAADAIDDDDGTASESAKVADPDHAAE